ncbi:MAG: hydantoinase/oxoprolinase family protein [Thalassobaculum sp.]|uniref:hydantoinase/oxoprolinase family protein n=1 Tax=Thalassobaculum sp. TaxID=2022740 RepID=UPI0032EBF70F
MSGRYVIGVDVGGTFTDVFILDQQTGTGEIRKVPSTRPDQSQGFLAGIRSGVDTVAAVATVVHGTTVGTNALLERRGAATGIITTAGFRDVLEMRRRDRPTTWGLWGQFEPVIPRDRRLEVPERVLADGSIHTPVDLDAVTAAANQLLADGCEAVAVAFINAYANTANEEAALEAVRAVWPNEHVTGSHRILPEIREFERISTATLNAYLQPVVANYLQRLQDALRGDGFAGDVLIVQSNGGVMTVDTARRVPIRTALSGPAAGVIAGAHIATSAGFPNIVTCDMGGTSFDVSLVVDGQTALTPQTSIDFGMVVRQPMIEITTIGAGGGSIAWVDRGGLLQIGPESAGSDPGPVCYGLGNDRPTVTDANVVLGRINAERPIGGKLARLDVEAAKAAIEATVGQPLGLSVMAAAEAIIKVANSRMAGAIRLVSIERGHDPKSFVAMPFGGGGALHAGALIKEVGLAGALVPRFPGVTSALGCVIADMRHDFVRTINGLLDTVDIAFLDGEAAAFRNEGQALLDRAGVAFEGRETLVELDMSYLGQTHTVAVPLTVHGTDGDSLGIARDAIRTAFEARYHEVYGRVLERLPIRVLNVRVTAVGRRPKFDLSILAPGVDGSVEVAGRGNRPVFVDGAWHDAAIFDRLALPVGAVIPGPAVLEQSDATIFVEPDLQAEVDRFGNLMVRRKEPS